MSISLLSAVILLLFASIAMAKISASISRGFFPSLVYLGSLVVSILTASSLAPLLSSIIVTAVIKGLPNWLDFLSNLVEFFSYELDLAGIEPFLQSLETFSTNPDPFLLLAFQVGGAFVSLLLFWLLLPLTSVLAKLIIRALIRRKLGCTVAELDFIPSDMSSLRQHGTLLSAGVGALSAFLLTACIVGPLMGTLHGFAAAIRDGALSTPNLLPSLGIDTKWLRTITTYSHDLPGNVFYALGGDLIWRFSACCRINGEMFYLASSHEILVSFLSLLSKNFIIEMQLDLDALLSVLFRLSLMAFCMTLYVLAIGRLLPQRFLCSPLLRHKPNARGVRRFLFPGGRAIVYQPASADRAFVPQYLLSENNGVRSLTCQVTENIQQITYRIFAFDGDNRTLSALEVSERIRNGAKTTPVTLPLSTAYASIEVLSVNGLPAPGRNKGQSAAKGKLYYLASVFVLTLLIAFTIKSTLAGLFSLALPHLGIVPAEYATLLLPSLLMTLMLFALSPSARGLKKRKGK